LWSIDVKKIFLKIFIYVNEHKKCYNKNLKFLKYIDLNKFYVYFYDVPFA